MVAESYRRIENIDRIRKAYIMWRDIPIAELYHEFSSLSGEFDWAIKPLWDNWKKCIERGEYPDIAGIDDTTHKEVYYRRFDPSFVTQRVPVVGRDDYFHKMEEVGVRNGDWFEYLCRSHGVCGNDRYYVSRTPDKVIDACAPHCQFDIPDFDTDSYGWLSEVVNPSSD